MTTDTRKLLGNHGVKLAEQVASERLRRAGVTLGKDLDLPTPRAAKKMAFPRVSSSGLRAAGKYSPVDVTSGASVNAITPAS